jgi:alpha-beta hydrolase superfamily lysophospholipase
MENMMTACAKLEPNDAVEGTLAEERPIAIPHGEGYLTGSLALVPDPDALVLVANDQGCGRHSPAERALTAALRREGFATAIVDLLLPEEACSPERAAWRRLQVQELARRVGSARAWVAQRPELTPLPVVLLGHGAGGAAALLSAGARPAPVAGLVAWRGPPDVPDRLVVQCKDCAQAPLLRRVQTAIQRGRVAPFLLAG